jgi:hypothetical protein
MARSAASNFTSANEDFEKATAAGDAFERGDVQKLAEAVDQHAHEAGRGIAVRRIRSGAFADLPDPGNAGHLYLTTDVPAQLFFDNGDTAWYEVPLNPVTSSDLRDSDALSVIGRAAATAGEVADIVATAASDAVLRESGSVVGFGTIAAGGIASNAVTEAKILNGAVTNDKLATGIDAAKILSIAASTIPLNTIPATLTGKDADTVDGYTPGTTAGKLLILDGSGKVPTANLPTTLPTGTDSDSVDGYHAGGNTAGTLLILDGSGLVPLADIPTTLTGKTAAAATLAADSTLFAGENAAHYHDVANLVNRIGRSQLATAQGRSIVGRSAGTAGNIDDIGSAATDQVLRESGGTIGWGTMATGGIADGAVTNAKLATGIDAAKLTGTINTSRLPTDVVVAQDITATRNIRAINAVMYFGNDATHYIYRLGDHLMWCDGLGVDRQID